MGGPLCEECEKLWNEYQKALITYTDLVDKYAIALAAYDRPVIHEILPELEAAMRARFQLRDALFAHITAEHDQSNEAAG